MILIPTGRKARLPKGLSYPVGAEAISLALEGVPQFAMMKIFFSRPYRSLAIGEIKKRGGNIDVIWVAHYYPNIARYDGVLEIAVSAVPSEFSSSARDQILSFALHDLNATLKDTEIGEKTFVWKAIYNIYTKEIKTKNMRDEDFIYARNAAKILNKKIKNKK